MRVTVGRIGRPHGIRGELVIGVRTDEPDLRFTVGATLDAIPDDQIGSDGGARRGSRLGAVTGAGRPETGRPESRQLTITSTRWHSGQLLVTFDGVADRTMAGELTGTWLSVDTSVLPDLVDPDEFRDHELVGLSVRTAAGEQVGVVTDVLHHGQDLLVVRRPDRAAESLIPFVRAIVPEVDIAGGVLVIDPPPGLLDPE